MCMSTIGIACIYTTFNATDALYTEYFSHSYARHTSCSDAPWWLSMGCTYRLLGTESSKFRCLDASAGNDR